MSRCRERNGTAHRSFCWADSKSEGQVTTGQECPAVQRAIHLRYQFSFLHEEHQIFSELGYRVVEAGGSATREERSYCDLRVVVHVGGEFNRRWFQLAFRGKWSGSLAVNSDGLTGVDVWLQFAETDRSWRRLEISNRLIFRGGMSLSNPIFDALWYMMPQVCKDWVNDWIVYNHKHLNYGRTAAILDFHPAYHVQNY